MTPPALIGEGTVSEKVLDQALMESEVRTCFQLTQTHLDHITYYMIDLTAIHAKM